MRSTMAARAARFAVVDCGLAQENRDAAKVAQTLGINARNGWRGANDRRTVPDAAGRTARLRTLAEGNRQNGNSKGHPDHEDKGRKKIDLLEPVEKGTRLRPIQFVGRSQLGKYIRTLYVLRHLLHFSNRLCLSIAPLAPRWKLSS